MPGVDKGRAQEGSHREPGRELGVVRSHHAGESFARSGPVRLVDEAERQACDQPNLVAAVRKSVGSEEVLADRSHDQFPSFDHLLSVISMVEE